MAKSKFTRPGSKTPETPAAALLELPTSLQKYLADQQDHARELQDVLRLIKQASDTDNGALVVAWRMAHQLNVALDIVNLSRATGESGEARP